MTAKSPRIGIIGFGRFGRLLAGILKADFEVRVNDAGEGAAVEAASQAAAAMGVTFASEKETLDSDVIFYCVPISQLEPTLTRHAQYLNDGKKRLFVDVLSVKVHAKNAFSKLLPADSEALLTHPMFGPDSVAAKGLAGQTIVMDQFRCTAETYSFWKKYFAGKGLKIIEMTAEEHDRVAAESQGLTHFIGRVLGEFGFKHTPIDTYGAQMLHQIKEQVNNDSWQLFEDLQTHNPFTIEMRVRLSDAQSRVFNKLLPNRVNKENLVVGIQGGRGSFNEEAATYYLSRTPNVPYELVYLHTTDNVLQALYEGRVDRGQFAIHNSTGGVVTESIMAMANHRFHIVEEYAIKIAHALMIAPGADFNQCDTIMTHDQVLRQCKTNLEMKYHRLRQTSGEGDLADHAKVAELLSRGEIPPTVATMGSKVLAAIYGLDIVEEGLQDLQENFTSFLWVERPH
ncbi:MAG: prephenate dehydrogenase/arogenate dehydrogenase family protein [Cyanobacteria bacterium SZAS LIN-3]|nr:prephenate dehydrogenase/arogenate dehydrogenase family protein [Cyanobacteria bacterium SZAS LIN-3]